MLYRYDKTYAMTMLGWCNLPIIPTCDRDSCNSYVLGQFNLEPGMSLEGGIPVVACVPIGGPGQLVRRFCRA